MSCVLSPESIEMLQKEPFFRDDYRKLAVYISLISKADENGVLKITPGLIPNTFLALGYNKKMAYYLVREFVRKNYLKRIKKSEKDGGDELIIPEICGVFSLAKILTLFATNFSHSTPLFDSKTINSLDKILTLFATNPRQLPFLQIPLQDTDDEALRGKTKKVNNRGKKKPLSNPQKIEGGGGGVFEELSTAKLLISGEPFKEGDNNSLVEVYTPTVSIRMREEEKKEKLKKEKKGYFYISPSGLKKEIKYPPSEYHFLGEVIKITYCDYMKFFVEVYKHFEEGDKMTQFIRWFDQQLAKRPAEKAKDWWGELHGILKQKEAIAHKEAMQRV